MFIYLAIEKLPYKKKAIEKKAMGKKRVRIPTSRDEVDIKIESKYVQRFTMQVKSLH